MHHLNLFFKVVGLGNFVYPKSRLSVGFRCVDLAGKQLGTFASSTSNTFQLHSFPRILSPHCLVFSLMRCSSCGLPSSCITHARSLMYRARSQFLASISLVSTWLLCVWVFDLASTVLVRYFLCVYVCCVRVRACA